MFHDQINIFPNSMGNSVKDRLKVFSEKLHLFLVITKKDGCPS
ncbi:hypothetical protein PT2222_130095 [Paraburkholderia tropica]